METRPARSSFGSPPHTAYLRAIRRRESVCFLTALRFKASSLPTETNAGVAVPCIQKKRKEREPPPPTPGRPADLFPGKMCSKRGGGGAFCGCCPDLEPRSTSKQQQAHPSRGLESEVSRSKLRGPASLPAGPGPG